MVHRGIDFTASASSTGGKESNARRTHEPISRQNTRLYDEKGKMKEKEFFGKLSIGAELTRADFVTFHLC